LPFSDQALSTDAASSHGPLLQHHQAADTSGTGGDLEAQHDSASSTEEAAQQSQYSSNRRHVTILDPLGHPVDLTTERSVPVALSDVRLPVSALAPNSCDDKHKRHQKKHSSGSSSSSRTGKTGKTGKTGASGISDFFSEKGEEIHEAAHNLKLHVNHPQQVTSPHTKSVYQHVLAWVGRIGWCGKAVVYAMIGGLACDSAAHGPTPTPNVSVQNQITASPQGAFVLLGTTPGGPGASIAVLLIMMVALAAYITWRFWEGLAGQGYDRSFSAKKNFFKFRVSPIVSGCVYCSYLVFILELLDREVRHLPDQGSRETWPATWRHTGLGRAGLALMGVAFVIATCIQLQGVLSKQWHRDYRRDLPPRFMKAVFTIGHFGFAGRGGAFLALAILFFKDAGGVEADAPHQYSMVANALQQLQANRGLRAILMIIGLLLVTYGLFATLSSWARVFPTPSPTRERPVPASVIQDCEEKSQSPPEVEQCELAGEEEEQLPREVYQQEGGHQQCSACGGGNNQCKGGCRNACRHLQQSSAPLGVASGATGQPSDGHLRPRAQVLYTTPLVPLSQAQLHRGGAVEVARAGNPSSSVLGDGAASRPREEFVSIDMR
jgi:hypothetical protein